MNHTKTKTQVSPLISPQQVKDYLTKHPDFFVDHPNLLEFLTIPHPSGEAVSLVTKQLDLLRKKNQHLNHKLDELVQIARQNDQLFQRMHQLTLALFASPTLDDAIDSLEKVLYDDFLADFVVLRLIKPGNNARFPDLLVDPSDKRLTSFKKVMNNQQPVCGKIKLSQSIFLFGANADEVKSGVIIPLQSANLSGLLAIGSRDQQRFQPDLGHLFLNNIGELTSLGLSSFFHEHP